MPAKRFFLLFFLLFLYGCQHAAATAFPIDPIVTETETPFPTFAPYTPTQDSLPEEQELWKQSLHANTYNLENASNTYCARCHSPLNWDPASSSGAQQVVSKSEWKSIPCTVCHEQNGNNISGTVSFWDQGTKQYEQVKSSSDLCIQCHTDEENHNALIKMGTGAHMNFDCVTCHEPHSLKASCSNAGCHQNIRPESSLPPSTPTGGQHPANAAFCGGASCHPAATQAAASNTSIHGAVHASVSCIACHDASGMAVGPSPERGAWITFATAEPGGMQTSGPAMSHDIQASADCARCHFEGNTWNLPQVSGNEFGN